jgi:SecD/SecF fusion protein
MAVSVLLIAVGLVVFGRQGQRNFNIDFTGGTLVTLQLDPNEKSIKDMNDADRAEYVRKHAAEAVMPDTNPPRALPNISVESLNVAGEGKASRFNVRTTETRLPLVQDALIKEFGSSLKRLTASVGEPSPIPKAAANSDRAERFEDGLAFPLTFSRKVDPDQLQLSLANFLRGKNVQNPDSRFGVVPVQRRSSAPADELHETLEVRTNLEMDQAKTLLAGFVQTLPNDPSLTFERRENFGAAVARDTQLVAMFAIVASWLVIIAYLWLRFKSVAFGLAAVIALVHDVLIALGAVALSPYKIDLPMIAAFLTIIGFSVNDTIVIFDRIREIKGKTPYLTEGIINAAVNQTLSRTILTSLTALLVVVVMYVFGGEALRGFSFCLLVGFLSGIYSTIYIASPILIDWMGKKTTDTKPKAATATAK